MEIPTERKGNVTIASISAREIDAGNVEDLRRSLNPVIDASTWLVLDLGRLEFIDSSGLGAFLSALRRLSARGGDLKLCALTPQVRSAFELVRMHRIFDIFKSADEAVAAFVR